MFSSGRASLALVTGILLIASGRPAKAGATIAARSVSFADVSSAINLARSGDTVTIPSGSATWTSTLTITKNISIIGAGIGQTIIIDEVPKSCTGGSTAIFMVSATSTTVLMQISGMTLQGGTINTCGGSGDTGGSATIQVNMTSTTPNFRIDHIYFHNLYARNMQFYGSALGVVDHCVADTTHWQAFVEVQHNRWKGVGSAGDNSWADDTGFGTQNALFFEDNTYNGFSTATCLDIVSGGRAVFRYNTVTHANVGNHGTETSGRLRGARSMEVYNNTFMAGVSGSEERAFAVYLRGGAAVIHDNTFGDNTGLHNYDSMVVMSAYKLGADIGPWRIATGSNPWDLNDTTNHTDNGFGGGANGLYASGTATSGGSLSMTKTAAGWTTNQWQGYSIQNIVTTRGAVIKGNTATTINYTADTQTGHNLTFNPGDGFEIRKVLAVIDQVGRGKGTLIANFNSPTPVGWPNEALEPVYIWNNTFLGGGNGNGQPMVYAQVYSIQPNRDYYVGTPMPGYVPYTYPHPLTKPNSPSNLRVIGP